MVKVAVLGSTVAKHFLDTGHEVVTTYRAQNGDLCLGDEKYYYDPTVDGPRLPFSCDYVINCIGVIKPFIEDDKLKSIYLNSVFPRELADFCNKKDIKLIHITTDCVFSGATGNYSEESDHDCLDFYGKTKSLGEPENCMVLRTSIIGEEIHKDASLIAWVKSMAGKEINGYTNHFWNGVTTNQYAKICKHIIDEDLYSQGLFHIHSNTVSKFELVTEINNRFNLDIKINPQEPDQAVDRTLSTVSELSNEIMKHVPTVQEQILDL